MPWKGAGWAKKFFKPDRDLQKRAQKKWLKKFSESVLGTFNSGAF